MKNIFVKTIMIITALLLYGCGAKAANEQNIINGNQFETTNHLDNELINNSVNSQKQREIEEFKKEKRIKTKHTQSIPISSNIDSDVITEYEIIQYYNLPIVSEIENVNYEKNKKDNVNTDIINDTDIINNNDDNSDTDNCFSAEYGASDFQFLGVVYWSDWRWTWYSERVLPGGGLDIPGRHTDVNGYVCDENDYICLAATSLSKGTVVDTPFGKQGKVYDSGCAYGTLDVYVNW